VAFCEDFPFLPNQGLSNALTPFPISNEPAVSQDLYYEEQLELSSYAKCFSDTLQGGEFHNMWCRCTFQRHTVVGVMPTSA
jgi:hypothetical protein